MKIWLVQRAESTPHDDEGNRRLMRMGVLADLLQAKGHTVVWWTSAFDHVSHSFRFNESTRVVVKPHYFIHYLKAFGYKNNKSISRLIDNKVVANQFTDEARKDANPPDILLVSMPSIELAQHAVHYANERNIPVYIDIRDLWPDVFYDYFPWYLSGLVKLATIPMRHTLKQVCKNATGITGITEQFVQWGVNYSGRNISAHDIHFPMAYVRHQHTESTVREASEFWRNLGVIEGTEETYILFLGTFTASFDFATVFAAAELVENVDASIKFIFCGNGAKEESVRNACDQLENCIFAGWVNAAQIHVALTLSDIGIAPYIESSNFVNNIPNKPAEYMSEGLIIATSLTKGALFDLIESEQCGFCYGQSPEQLAEHLLKLSKNREELGIMKEFLASVYEERFDGNKIYGAMISYLEEAARKS